MDTLLSKSYDKKLSNSLRLKYSDELYQILKKSKNDSIIRHYFFKLSGRYHNLKEYEKYKTVCKEVLKMATESNDSLSIAKSLHYLGDYYFIKYNNDSAYYYYNKAERKYEQFKINSKEAQLLKLYKANILYFQRDYSACEIAIIKILKTVDKNTDVRVIYECYIALGNALEGLNNSKKALEYYNKAFDLTEKLKQDSQYKLLKSQTYNYIGKVYQKQENHKLAISYFQKGLGFDNSNPTLYSNLLNNLGYSMFKNGNINALQYLNKSLKIRNNIKSTPGIVSSKICLAEYYFANNSFDLAFKNAKEAKSLAHDNRIFEDELKALNLLAQIDPKNDTFYNNQFINLNDSLQNNERNTRNKFARIEFETEEITHQKNTIEAEKNKIASQIWIILGLSVVVILILGLLYLAKIQHAKNKQLQFEKEQQTFNQEIYELMLNQQSKIEEGRIIEKKRISRELHDGIMGKLASTRLNLFILSKKTDEETIQKCLTHIVDIQNIEKEIRNISHNLVQDIFKNQNNFQILIEDLFKENAKHSKSNIKFQIDPSIVWENIDNNIKMNVYRIFQEALQNIQKYATAKNILLNISQNENKLTVEINDDGIGFNIQRIKTGIGLKNMKTRMESIDGKFKITSKKDKGTQINLIIPLKKAIFTRNI